MPLNKQVSLMRGNAEYFAQLKAKNAMQEEVERLRSALVLCPSPHRPIRS